MLAYWPSKRQLKLCSNDAVWMHDNVSAVNLNNLRSASAASQVLYKAADSALSRFHDFAHFFYTFLHLQAPYQQTANHNTYVKTNWRTPGLVYFLYFEILLRSLWF